MLQNLFCDTNKAFWLYLTKYLVSNPNPNNRIRVTRFQQPGTGFLNRVISQLTTSCDCLTQLHHWFCVNGLALNPDKSEAIWFSTRQRSESSTPVSSVNIAGSIITTSSTVKTLGITLDNRLSLDQHVSSVCKSAFFHLCAFAPHPLCTL